MSERAGTPRLVLKLAWRSLWRNKRRTAITLSSIGIGLGLAIFFAATGRGVYREVTERAVRAQSGHLVVEHPAFRDDPSPAHAVPDSEGVRALVAAVPGVRVVRPLVVGQAVASTASASAGVALMGVDPPVEADVSPVPRKVTAGRFLAGDDGRGLVIGAALADRLSAQPGKKVVLTTTSADGELNSDLLRVVGVFETGAEDADGALALVTLPVARRVFGLPDGAASQIGLMIEDADRQPEVTAALARAVGGRGLALRTWQEVMPEIAGWIALDTQANRTQRGFVLFLVGFTILNTILMSVIERHREFAVALALGTPPALLRAQVFAEAVLLAALGTALGVGLGTASGLYMEHQGIDFRSLLREGTSVGRVHLDAHVFGDVTPGLVAGHAALVFGATVAIGLYPVYRATRIAVADLLRSR